MLAHCPSSRHLAGCVRHAGSFNKKGCMPGRPQAGACALDAQARWLAHFALSSARPVQRILTHPGATGGRSSEGAAWTVYRTLP